MNPDIKVIIYEEKNILKKLLGLLDEQYELAINKDVIKLDNIVSELDLVSKELAKAEIKRRNIMKNENDMVEIIRNCDDENIIKAYHEIKSLIKMIEIQKEANKALIRQNLFFTKKMMNFINPNKGIGTYNARGQVGK